MPSTRMTDDYNCCGCRNSSSASVQEPDCCGPIGCCCCYPFAWLCWRCDKSDQARHLRELQTARTECCCFSCRR